MRGDTEVTTTHSDTEGKAVTTYGLQVLAVDTFWTMHEGRAVAPYVELIIRTVSGEKTVTAHRSADGGVHWSVLRRGDEGRVMEARGTEWEVEFITEHGLGEVSFMESVFSLACVAVEGDYEAELFGEVEVLA